MAVLRKLLALYVIMVIFVVCTFVYNVQRIRHSREDPKFSSLPKKLENNLTTPFIFPECGSNGLFRPQSPYYRNKGWMLMIVKSAPGNFKLRNTIRTTWGSVKQLNGLDVRAVFLLGVASERAQEALMKHESDHYKDMLQCNVMDSYKNITLKVLSAYQWFANSSMDWTHATFCDDDIVVNVPQMFNYFKHNVTKGDEDKITCEFLYCEDCKPHRERGSKWRLGTDLYSESIFPAFCHGAMYTLSLQMVKNIHNVAMVTDSNAFYLDDVFITGILRYKYTRTNSKIGMAHFGDKKAEIMFYPGGEGVQRFEKILQKWESWKNDLNSYKVKFTLDIL